MTLSRNLVVMPVLSLLWILPCSTVPAKTDVDLHNRLHIVYVTNQDRDPLPAYRERLGRIMIDVQDFYRTEMDRNGYGPMTFRLDLDNKGKPAVHLATLDWAFDPKRRFTPQQMSPFVSKALAKRGVDAQQSYFIVFMNAYWQDGDVWKYDVVYTGYGGPERGAAWVADHAWLDPRNFDPKLRQRINDRGQKLSIGQFNVKMLGGVAHELGHGLGLPHNRERPDDLRVFGKALMGGGNYTYRKERLTGNTGSFLTAPHAFALSKHPLFTRARPDDFSVPEASVENLKFEHDAGMLVVSGRVVPANAISGVVLYHDRLPTGVNKDYDAWSYLAKATKDGRFVSAVDLPASGEHALHLCAYYRNGLHRKFTFTHEVTGQAKPDLSALRRDYAWSSVKAAFGRKDLEALRRHARTVAQNDSGRLKQVERLLGVAERWESFATPAQAPAGAKTLALCCSRWESASVGWYIPSFDGVLDPDGASLRPLRSSKGNEAHGLYAHASSKYVYDLGGRWKTLQARCGLQQGNNGSVVFVVVLDGKEAHRSGKVRLAGGEKAIDVDVEGARTLELIVEPADDGKSSDWGVWFAPILKR